jgi:nucleotidyltransferase/DNA polymerase involved in DNA repair
MNDRAAQDYSKAILHFDGDSFFASVEQALNHTLRGKVVITGGERGAVTAVSIEGKRLGLGRGLSLRQIRLACPQAVVVSSDYISYGIFARRMYAIVRRHAPVVEEYSIDECFADITGLARPGRSYEDIATDIHRELERALGITFGVGLAPSKVLAKVASKHRKPGGFTAIPASRAREFLAGMHIGQVWGIGRAMAENLTALGITDALSFANQTPQWLQSNHIARPYRAIWHELRGTSINPVAASLHEAPASIIKSRTFSPASNSRAFVYSQLSLNVERACARARRAGVLARRLSFHLKTQEFMFGRAELDLAVPTNNPADLLRNIHPRFDTLFKEGVEYRATGVSLGGLVPADSAPLDLFSGAQAVEEHEPVLKGIDALNRRFGAGTVYAGSTMAARKHRAPDHRRRAAMRTSVLEMPNNLRHKRLDIPFLGTAQ